MLRFACLTLLFGTLAACGSARVVERTQYGGTLALEGDQNKASEDAHAQMQAHCRGPYTIVREGEAVVGEQTDYVENTRDTRRGSRTRGGAVTSDVTEWRITYQCGVANPGAAPPPAAPEPGGPPGY
jgi:hypothetical protein